MSIFKRSPRKSRALTLVELTVVLIVIGILASLALPLFVKTVETTKGKEAEVALEQIWAGQKIYRSEGSFYFPKSPGNENNITTINTRLRTELDTRANRNWNYSINSPADNAFTATATRTTGKNSGETVTYDQNRTKGGSFTP